MEDYIYDNAEKNIKFQTFLGDTYNIIIYLFTMCIFIFSSEIEILLALLLLTVYVTTISYFFIKSIVKSKKKETIKFSKTTNNYTQELNKSISVFTPVLVSLATIFNFETWQEGKSLFILALSFFVMICVFPIIEKKFFKIKNDLKIILDKYNKNKFPLKNKLPLTFILLNIMTFILLNTQIFFPQYYLTTLILYIFIVAFLVYCNVNKKIKINPNLQIYKFLTNINASLTMINSIIIVMMTTIIEMEKKTIQPPNWNIYIIFPIIEISIICITIFYYYPPIKFFNILLKKIETKDDNAFIATFQDGTKKHYKNIFSFEIINDKNTEERLKSVNKTKFYIKRNNEQKEYIKIYEINNSKNSSLLIYSESNNNEIKVATDCLKEKKDFLVSFIKEIKNYDIIPSVSNIFMYIYSISILFVNERMYTLISLATIFLYFLSTCFCKKISKYLFLKRNITTINKINKILADFSPFILPLIFLVNAFINKKLLIFMSLFVLVYAFSSSIKYNCFKKKKPENFQFFIEFTDKTVVCLKINFLDYFKYITPDTYDYIIYILKMLATEYFEKEISNCAYNI